MAVLPAVRMNRAPDGLRAGAETKSSVEGVRDVGGASFAWRAVRLSLPWITNILSYRTVHGDR